MNVTMLINEVESDGTMNPVFDSTIIKLINLKMSLPVNSADAERSFSTMTDEKVETPSLKCRCQTCVPASISQTFYNESRSQPLF